MEITMPKDIYTTQRKLNEILDIGGIEPSITNDYLDEAHGYPVPWRLAMFDNTGIPHTEATKKKMSENSAWKVGGRNHRPMSKEHIRKNSEAMTGEKNHFYGKKHTEAAKKKMSEARKGKKMSPEHIIKIREGHKAYYEGKRNGS